MPLRRLRQKVAGPIIRRFADFAQGAGKEAAQEYLAQVANNIATQQAYVPDRGCNEGAAEPADRCPSRSCA